MGGKGNAADIVDIATDMIQHPPWIGFFEDFEFPYSFFSDEEYGTLLDVSGFKARRIELIPKDMVQQGKEGLAGWLRTTWMPYIERVPADQQARFVNEIIDRYLYQFPLDNNGQAHVQMVRLEVEAVPESSSKD
jgi:trans-aconitate methyltransferase